MRAGKDNVVLGEQVGAFEMEVFVGSDVVLIAGFFEPVGYVKVAEKANGPADTRL